MLAGSIHAADLLRFVVLRFGGVGQHALEALSLILDIVGESHLAIELADPLKDGDSEQ